MRSDFAFQSLHMICVFFGLTSLVLRIIATYKRNTSFVFRKENTLSIYGAWLLYSLSAHVVKLKKGRKKYSCDMKLPHVRYGRELKEMGFNWSVARTCAWNIEIKAKKKKISHAWSGRELIGWKQRTNWPGAQNAQNKITKRKCLWQCKASIRLSAISARPKCAKQKRVGKFKYPRPRTQNGSKKRNDRIPETAKCLLLHSMGFCIDFFVLFEYGSAA